MIDPTGGEFARELGRLSASADPGAEAERAVERLEYWGRVLCRQERALVTLRACLADIVLEAGRGPTWVANQGMWQLFTCELGQLDEGVHRLTLRYQALGQNDGHYIDFIEVETYD